MATDDAGGLVQTAVDRLVAASVRERASLAAALGLQRTDLDAMRCIAVRDAVTPSGLARALMLSSGGTAAVVDRLAQAGLVTRTPHTDNRRRVALRLTDQGRAAIGMGRATLLRDVAALTAGRPLEQRAALEQFVTRLADAAEGHADRLARDLAATAPAPAGQGPTVLWG